MMRKLEMSVSFEHGLNETLKRPTGPRPGITPNEIVFLDVIPVPESSSGRQVQEDDYALK